MNNNGEINKLTQSLSNTTKSIFCIIEKIGSTNRFIIPLDCIKYLNKPFKITSLVTPTPNIIIK